MPTYFGTGWSLSPFVLCLCAVEQVRDYFILLFDFIALILEFCLKRIGFITQLKYLLCCFLLECADLLFQLGDCLFLLIHPPLHFLLLELVRLNHVVMMRVGHVIAGMGLVVFLRQAFLVVAVLVRVRYCKSLVDAAVSIGLTLLPPLPVGQVEKHHFFILRFAGRFLVICGRVDHTFQFFDLVLLFEDLIGKADLGLLVGAQKVHDALPVLANLLLLLPVLRLQLLEGHTQLLDLPLEAGDLLRSAHDFLVDGGGCGGGEKFSEDEPGLLVLIVVVEAVLQVFEEVDIRTEEVGECLGRSGYALFLHLPSHGGNLAEVTAAGDVGFQLARYLLSEALPPPILEILHWRMNYDRRQVIRKGSHLPRLIDQNKCRPPRKREGVLRRAQGGAGEWTAVQNCGRGVGIQSIF